MCVCVCVCVTERWTDTLLYVKNIGESVTEDELRQVFTDAEDIVISKADSRRKDDKKTRYAQHCTQHIAQDCIQHCAQHCIQHSAQHSTAHKIAHSTAHSIVTSEPLLCVFLTN